MKSLRITTQEWDRNICIIQPFICLFTHLFIQRFIQQLLWLLCEVLEVLGIWLYIITFFPGFDNSFQLTTIQLWVIHTYSSLPFTPMLHYFGRQSINMCCPDNFEEWIPALNTEERPTSLCQRNLFLKSHQSDPNFSQEALQRCLSKFIFSSEKGHSELYYSDEISLLFSDVGQLK